MACGLLAALVLVAFTPARAFPGPVDPEIVGDWACGGTVIAITAGGGIDLSGEDTRAGAIRAGRGLLIIVWDGGGRSEWSYAAGDGALILGTDRGANYACLAAD